MNLVNFLDVGAPYVTGFDGEALVLPMLILILLFSFLIMVGVVVLIIIMLTKGNKNDDKRNTKGNA